LPLDLEQPMDTQPRGAALHKYLHWYHPPRFQGSSACESD
jgi:hypothetical protein